MAGLGLQEEYKSTMTGGLAPQAEQQLAQTAARQRFGGNKNFGDVARNQQLQTQLAASHKEQSDRLFKYKELAQRQDMATEAQRQFDVSTKQQATQFEEQKAFEYAQQRRDSKQSLAGFIFNK